MADVVLRWAAHRRDANAYGKYFDGGTVKVTSNPFVHVAAVCFDADPKDDINTFPHVRAITIVQP